jgi:hypothetical protein
VTAVTNDLPPGKFEITKSITITPAEPGPKFAFRNYYRCPNDGTMWKDEWSCMCNDRCPTCGAEIEPYESEDI